MKRPRVNKSVDEPLHKVSKPDTMLVQRDDVPEYLRPGAFYQSLFNEDDDKSDVIVPSDVLKPDTIIKSVSDLVHYLSSLRFWGVQDLTLDDVAPFILSLIHI